MTGKKGSCPFHHCYLPHKADVDAILGCYCHDPDNKSSNNSLNQVRYIQHSWYSMVEFGHYWHEMALKTHNCYS